MRIPALPEEFRWKLVVNTFCEYQDGEDFAAQTRHEGTMVVIPERSTIILVAERVS